MGLQGIHGMLQPKRTGVCYFQARHELGRGKIYKKRRRKGIKFGKRQEVAAADSKIRGGEASS